MPGYAGLGRDAEERKTATHLAGDKSPLMEFPGPGASLTDDNHDRRCGRRFASSRPLSVFRALTVGRDVGRAEQERRE
jgi:hypothetical protein